MYDLCLMAYGTLDLVVKFCTDNGIDDINYVPVLPQMFNYDPTLTNDQIVNNYVYTTAIGTPIAPPATNYYVDQSGNYYVDQNSNNYIPNP